MTAKGRPKLDAVTKEGARHLAHARRLSDKIEQAREAQSSYAAERATAVRAAIDAGVSKAQVARELGITAPAVNAILSRHEK